MEADLLLCRSHQGNIAAERFECCRGKRSEGAACFHWSVLKQRGVVVFGNLYQGVLWGWKGSKHVCHYPFLSKLRQSSDIQIHWGKVFFLSFMIFIGFVSWNMQLPLNLNNNKELSSPLFAPSSPFWWGRGDSNSFCFCDCEAVCCRCLADDVSDYTRFLIIFFHILSVSPWQKKREKLLEEEEW